MVFEYEGEDPLIWMGADALLDGNDEWETY